MSRLTELLRQARKTDPQLGADLEAEIGALTKRRTFGLVFERHQPEAVELPGRGARRGDKVRVLPPRGETKPSDQRLWQVVQIERTNEQRVARLIELGVEEPETKDVPTDDLAVVAEFRDHIYPGLIETGRIERGGDKPFHTVINAENYHALEMLTYTHRHSIDAIYIDPPYNTGAKDWKYNNDYVAEDDDYRHSKWLAFMERRLKAARELLDPDDSVLIVTIDEREYLRLGLLLEQIFPAAALQMISSVINPKGVVRFNELTRTSEFIFVAKFGNARLTPERSRETTKVRWPSLRRYENSSRRGGPQPGPYQFYPIYVGKDSGVIESIGEPIPLDVERSTVPDRENCYTVWPLKPDGTEMTWGLTPPTLESRLANGFVKVSRSNGKKAPTFSYLTSEQIKYVASGDIIVTGKDYDGSVLVEFATGKASLPTTQWDRESHNAQSNGTNLLSSLVPRRRFPYAKSLYALEDVLRLAVGANPEAVVLDFFSGSGTTAHAVMRLNRQDGGRRQCISVTNNEVSADEQKRLRQKDLRPGDKDWESLGICDFITKPRITAAIMGKTPQGEPIKGDYKFTDKFPMSDGFEENAAFFTLTYESRLSIMYGRAFERIAPMLWLRAGSRGRIITSLAGCGWDVAESYAVLKNLDRLDEFTNAVAEAEGVDMAFVVTDDDSAFQMVCRELPTTVTPIRLYESYLQNFEINTGRSL